MMYERFTDRARRVMQLANQEALRGNWTWVTAAHILCGILKERNGVGGTALQSLGLTLDDIRRFIPPQPEEERLSLDKLPHDESARKLTEDAIFEARDMQDNYVGTEHLLLGLLRQSDGAAIESILSIGLSNYLVRKRVLSMLGDIRLAKSFRDEVAALIVKHKGSNSAESALINCIAACITAVDAAGEK